MVNRIIRECNKLAPKEWKTRYEWVGKIIPWELYKKLKFDHTDKWYMHNPESFQENGTHKILRDFEIQTDHLISTRPCNNHQPKKRIGQIEDFAVLADHRVKLKESEKKDKYLDFAVNLEKLWTLKVTVIPIVIGALGIRELRNKSKSGDHPNYSFI